VVRTHVHLDENADDWRTAIIVMSDPKELTLVTCYPRDSTIIDGVVGTTGLYMVQLEMTSRQPRSNEVR
jgi:sortase (surface protein transpeptidase)